MANLRGGLIGCGFFARNQMHGWKEVRGAQIVAVCDTDMARAEAFRRDYAVEAAYTDAARMLQEANLDFVDIVTQPGSHRALVELAAAYRMPVICQKPMALTREDAQVMVEACRRASVPFMIHENFRWQTPMRAVQAAAETIGPRFFGRIAFRTPYDVYANQPYLAEEPRFLIADLGVHLLDLARFFFGEVATLTAQIQRVNPRIQGEDVATILLKMRSGAVCIVDASYASKLEEDLFPQTLVHIEGADGSVTLGPHYRLTQVLGSAATHREVPPRRYSWSAPPAQAIQESVVAIQQHWADCLREGREPETSGADNLKTLELVFGAYESAATGQPYDI
jgi:predicted dehydrogenase